MSDMQESESHKLTLAIDEGYSMDALGMDIPCLQYAITDVSDDSKTQLDQATRKDWRGPHQQRLENFALDYFGACWFNSNGEMEVCDIHRAAKLERSHIEQVANLGRNHIKQAAELDFDQLEQAAELEWNRIEQTLELAWNRIEQYCATQPHCPRFPFPSVDGPSDDTSDNRINSWLDFMHHKPRTAASDNPSNSSFCACSTCETSSSPFTMYTTTQLGAIGSHLPVARSAKQSYAVALTSPPPKGMQSVQKRQPAVFKLSASNATPGSKTKIGNVNDTQLSGASSQDKPRGHRELWKLWENQLEVVSLTKKGSRFAEFFNSSEYTEAVERAREVANLVETHGEAAPLFFQLDSNSGNYSNAEMGENFPKAKALGGSFDSARALDGSQDDPQYRALASEVDELVNPGSEGRLIPIYTANIEVVSPTPSRPFYWNFFAPDSDSRSLSIIESSIPVAPMPAHFVFYSLSENSRHPASLSSIEEDDNPFFTSRPVTADTSSFTQKLLYAGLIEGMGFATQSAYRSPSIECFVCGNTHDDGHGHLYQLKKQESLWI